MDYTDLKRRLEAATEGVTPGPWHPCGWDVMSGAFDVADAASDNDATFIAAARQLVPEALAAIAALEAEVARLRGELHRLPDIVHAIPTQYEDFDGTMRDTTAEWVHGRAYNTVYERARAALADQPTEGEK